MENKKENCYFCGSKLEYYERNPSESRDFYICPICGRYRKIDPIGYSFDKFFDKQKTISYLYYKRKELNKDYPEKYPIDKMFISLYPKGREWKKEYDHEIIVTEVDIDNWYPKSFQEIIDKILLFLAEKLAEENKGMGATIKFEKPEELYTIFFMRNINKINFSSKEFLFFKSYFENSKELEIIVNENENTIEIQILPEGYNKIYELQKNDPNNKKVLIAMCFDDKYKKIEETIEEAVAGIGYEANTIRKKPHNNWIMSEILYEIKNSKFIIADLTGNNRGVYYEAGFAEALNKQVILTYQNTDDEKLEGVHFDVKQKFIILYKDLNNKEERENFIKNLQGQIKGTVGLPK